MAKVTSKLQVTVPKALADIYRIRPGDQIAWEAADDAIRMVPARRGGALTSKERLKLFDAATERQRRRNGTARRKRPSDRGWSREELYGSRGAH